MPFFSYYYDITQQHKFGAPGMFTKFFAAAMLSTVIGMTMAAPEAQARRLFWWQQLPPENGGGYDVYGDGQDINDGQDAFAQDLFNQEQYDQYMQEMNHRRHRRIYDQSYYDPQFENPDNPMPHAPKRKVLKYKKPAKVAAAPKPYAAPKSTNSQIANVAQPRPNPASVEKITPDAPTKSASVSCTKGASIVTSYGFSAVTQKTCSGGTYVYGATRSGKNFEIQVSAASGELTAVKKL
jgi:hypothetical protein